MNPVKIAHVTTVDISLRLLLLNQLQSLREAGYEVVGISAPGPDVAHLESGGIHAAKGQVESAQFWMGICLL